MVVNNSCQMRGAALGFGMSMDPPNARFDSRIGVTPPLDLRPDMGNVEPMREVICSELIVTQ